MIKSIKKYSIFVLSLLLVLSNFSYATQQMLCLMGDNDISCTCKMNEHIITPGKISIDAIDSPCCTNKTFELTNSNNLQKTENDNLKNVFTFSPVIINCEMDFTGNSALANSQPALKDHIPKSEIPILISSLLI